MFQKIQQAKPDPILGLNEQFRNDAREHKVNLTVGVYQDETGVIPAFDAVKLAQKTFVENPSFGYLPIDGDRQMGDLSAKLMLGKEDRHYSSNRFVSVQCPGGTGGLRVVADFLAETQSVSSVFCSSPTWGNHLSIFSAAGIRTDSYSYLDAKRTGLDFDGMAQSLRQIPEGQGIILHGCCHNPTGVDPSEEQWNEIVKIVKERNLLPILDCAYQGFGNGLDQDALACRLFSEQIDEMIIVQSFSKNFSLYNQRIGVVQILTKDESENEPVRSQLKKVVRSNYSNPPQFGSFLVRTVLSDETLTENWKRELEEMRLRIADLRKTFCNKLEQKCDTDFSHVIAQNGMFSFSGLQKEHAQQLRSDFGIYMLDNGRMNIAGLRTSNMDYVTDSIAKVVSATASV